MVRYSLDLIEEYKTLEKLDDIIKFFRRDIFSDKFKANTMINKAQEMQRMILDKIKKAIRVWGGAMLSNTGAEFVLA